MVGLIEEIQRDALNQNISVTSLLRRVKLAAGKLGINNVASWVDHELNGYIKVDVPEYRKIQGGVFAWNPYNGWIPIIGDLPDNLTTFEAREAVSSIEALVSKDDNGIHHSFHPGIVEILNEWTGYSFGKYALKFSRGHLINLVEAVRNNILGWALELEKQGIRGEGLSFSNSEKEQAQRVSNTYNFNNTGTFAGNFGSGNQSGDITLGDVDVSQSGALASQIRRYIPDLASSGVDAEELSNRLAIIESETNKSKPSQGLLKAALSDIRNMISGAGGSLIASGIITEIARILKS